MAVSRLIEGIDLETAGFDTLADDWALTRNITSNSVYARMVDSWGAAQLINDLVDGDTVMVTWVDEGQHVSVEGDVGSVGGYTKNSGYYEYSLAIDSLVKIRPLESDISQEWAEGTLPGGVGTKSAREWTEDGQTSFASTKTLIDAKALQVSNNLATVNTLTQTVTTLASQVTTSASTVTAAQTDVAAKASASNSAMLTAVAAKNEAIQFGNAIIAATWIEASAITGLSNNAIVTVLSSDTGAHTPVSGDYNPSGGLTPNAGMYKYSSSLLALVRISDTEAQQFKQRLDQAVAQVNLATAQANVATFANISNKFSKDNKSTYISIKPSASWNGVAGSGFTTPPIDPVRTSAKPACLLLVPPNQVFTNHVVVGVIAAANNNGRLDNLGLSKVKVYYEGSTVDILEPSYYSYLDTNGNPQTDYGWWCVLLHNGTHTVSGMTGGANAYFEAIPKDTTMQNRVIGPFTFHPRATLYDVELTIEPSQTIIAGSRYKTFLEAFTYISANLKNFAHITVKEPGNYDLTGQATTYHSLGYTVIDSTVPFTIAKSAYTTDSAALLRPKIEPLCFRGSNITFDMQNIASVYHESSGNRKHWMDGVNVVNSSGRNGLWRKGQRPLSYIVRDGGWWTECTVSDINDPFGYPIADGTPLVRNCIAKHGIRDVITDCACVVGTVTEDWDSSWWNFEVPALTVIYNGTEATATLALVGGNDASTRTFTATWGSNTASFAVVNSDAGWTANTNYTVQNVVDWLNTLPNWSAVVLDDTRRATLLSTIGAKGAAFTAINVKNTSQTLCTMCDMHSDWYQQNTAGRVENCIVMNNTCIGVVTQNIFITGTAGARDFLFINNSFYNKLTGDYNSGYDNNINLNSQLARTQSHLVIAHNSMATQGLTLRSDQAYNPDPYCLIANNAIRSISWTGSPTDIDLIISNNQFQDGNTAPDNSVGTVISGTEGDTFMESSIGDFSPNVALVGNLKMPIVSYNINGSKRAVLDCVGAI